ncbi:MAG: hypothetical protein DLM55_05035 [Acidimicrobiales bacterium]|nr:MAG: hypothetical protein DLM55_05035 [Acidimicrobiales bacterium]
MHGVLITDIPSQAVTVMNTHTSANADGDWSPSKCASGNWRGGGLTFNTPVAELDKTAVFQPEITFLSSSTTQHASL